MDSKRNISKVHSLSPFDIKAGFKKNENIEEYYSVLETIGRGKILISLLGSFGEVVKAIHKASKEVRAIKIIDKRKIMKHEVLM